MKRNEFLFWFNFSSFSCLIKLYVRIFGIVGMHSSGAENDRCQLDGIILIHQEDNEISYKLWKCLLV